MKKKIMLFSLLTVSFICSCSKKQNVVQNENVAEREIEISTDDLEDEMVDNSSENKKEEVSKEENKEENEVVIPLKTIKRNNKVYHYGDLKRAGYNLLYGDVYQKDGKRYQISKSQNYKVSYDIKSIKYVDKRQVGENLYVDSSGNMTTDIYKSSRVNRLNSNNLENISDTTRETLEETDKKIYEFNNYNLQDRTGSTFKKEVVDNMSFIKDYTSYSTIDNSTFKYNGYTYKVGKFKKLNSSVDEYRWIRYQSDDQVSFKYKEGYKYTTNDIRKDIDGRVEFVPIRVAYGNYNSTSNRGYDDCLDSYLCSNCNGAIDTVSSFESMYIYRKDYEALYKSAYNHRTNDNMDGVKSLTMKVVPFNKNGSYIAKYTSSYSAGMELSIFNKDQNESSKFRMFDKVNNEYITASSHPLFFTEKKTGYSATIKSNTVLQVDLPKIRMHKAINVNNGYQLQKVNDATYDTYKLQQSYVNEQGIFLDENIEVSSIIKNNLIDLFNSKKIVSTYNYTPNEEIKDYSLLGVDNTSTISLRSEIDDNNRISVYQRYVEDIKKTIVSTHVDEFALFETSGYYSFTYQRYFKDSQKYNLPYYLDENELKVTALDISAESFEFEITNIEEQEDEKKYLYVIEEID